jgi:hypothetical protein
MKTDIYVKSIVKRLDNLIHGSSPVSKWGVISKTTQQELDDIETQKYGEPLRRLTYSISNASKSLCRISSTGKTFESLFLFLLYSSSLLQSSLMKLWIIIFLSFSGSSMLNPISRLIETDTIINKLKE